MQWHSPKPEKSHPVTSLLCPSDTLLHPWGTKTGSGDYLLSGTLLGEQGQFFFLFSSDCYKSGHEGTGYWGIPDNVLASAIPLPWYWKPSAWVSELVGKGTDRRWKDRKEGERERERERERRRGCWWNGTDWCVGHPKAIAVLSPYSQTSVYCGMKHR